MCFIRKWVRFHAVLDVRQIIIVKLQGRLLEQAKLRQGRASAATDLLDPSRVG